MKVRLVSVSLCILCRISNSENTLNEEEIIPTDPAEALFFETYIYGTPKSLTYNSEKALKYVSSSSEDLQRLYVKEFEVRDLIEKYKSSIEQIVQDIRQKAEGLIDHEQFVRKIRKVTRTYFRPSEEFEATGGLGIVRLDDVHELDKLELANGTVNLPVWNAR